MTEEFNKLLEEYQGNYVQFVTTGISDYERAYKNAQTAIETILNNKREQVEKEKKDMKYFANSYKQDNEDLSGLFDSASAMYQDAQSIQDNYETSKTRYDTFTEKAPMIDIVNGYKLLFRIGIIFIIIPCVFLFMYYIVKSTSQTSTMPSYYY
jgi:CRISPR/Cas system CMR-associated protein Cmr5 small subunit